MINFYQDWKDEKESEPKKKKKRGVLCGSYVNGLKDHMEGVHGNGTYKRYVSAEEQLRKRRRQEIVKAMKEFEE